MIRPYMSPQNSEVDEKFYGGRKMALIFEKKKAKDKKYLII